MKKLLLITSILLIPFLVFATEVEVINEVLVEVQNEIKIDIGETLKISVPLKQSPLKGFIEGETRRFKFHINISHIDSITYLKSSKTTIINAPPIYGTNKMRSRIIIKDHVMSYAQLIKLLKSSEAWW